MKKFGFAMAAATVLFSAALSFAACGPAGTLVTEPNKGIPQGVPSDMGAFDETVYFEREAPADVHIHFDAEDVLKVSYKYRTLDEDEYNFDGETLTVDASVFEGESAGDKRLRVFVDENYVEVTVRVITKVIYTAEEFDAIRKDLNGVYVLGADIDFAGRDFWPIGKAYGSVKSGTFEGVLDGRGHSVSNITLNCYEYSGTNGEYSTGPSTGGQISNSANYNVGIFATTGGSAQIVDTAFYNITVNCQGLGGAIAGSNGGLIRNCRVSCTLFSRGECEKAAGIAGVNGSGDAAGRIENCIVVYTYGSGTPRGIADWNVGTIKNCYAAATDNFVYYPDFDYAMERRDPDFSYNTYLNDSNWTEWIYTNYSLPAFPGAVDTSLWKYYPGGKIIGSDVVRKEFLLDPANFSEENGWDSAIWNFTSGQFPTLKVQH